MALDVLYDDPDDRDPFIEANKNPRTTPKRIIIHSNKTTTTIIHLVFPLFFSSSLSLSHTSNFCTGTGAPYSTILIETADSASFSEPLSMSRVMTRSGWLLLCGSTVPMVGTNAASAVSFPATVEDFVDDLDGSLVNWGGEGPRFPVDFTCCRCGRTGEGLRA